MPELDLKAIRERCEKATPGPWSSEWRDDGGEGWHEISGPAQGGERRGVVASTLGRDETVTDDLDPHNAAFIASAREDIPALLAEVDRLRRLEAAARVGEAVVRRAVWCFEPSGTWHVGGGEPIEDATNRDEAIAIFAGKYQCDPEDVRAALDDAGEGRSDG